jgi:hypothetical protein
LVLSGNNSFTGGVTITAGAVRSSGGTTLSGSVPLGITTGTLDLPGSLTTAPGTIITKSGAGTLTIRGTQSHGAGAQLLVQQGTVNVNTDAGGVAAAKNLAVNATGGSVALGVSQHLASLAIGSGVTTTLAAGNRVIVTDALAVNGTGKLDLADGDLIVTSGTLGAWNGSSYTGVLGLVASARNGGSWNGAGVGTSQNTNGGLTTLAVASAQQALGGSGVFAGQTVGAGALLVSYTYGGDANLDGKVNVDDYGHIDSNVVLAGVSGWFNGDFNYDGKINVDDYGIIDFNVSIQGSKLGGGASALSLPPLAGVADQTMSGVSAVPEPLGLAPLLCIGAGALLRRRRKN